MQKGMVGVNLTFYDLEESRCQKSDESYDAAADYCGNDLLTDRDLIKAHFWGAFFGGLLGMLIAQLLVTPLFI